MKFVGSVVVSACLFACGSGSSSIATFDAVQPLDAGSCQENAYRHSSNGWLLTNPNVHMVFWGDWMAPGIRTPDSFQAAWVSLFNHGVLARLAEYGIHEGLIDGNDYQLTGCTSYTNIDDAGIETDDAGVKLLNDGLFAETIDSEIELGFLPYPDNNTLYVIYLPPGIWTQGMKDHSWSGYHNTASYGSQKYAYAVLSYSTEDIIASHEIYEATTDPDIQTGYYSKDGELADLCEGTNDYIGYSTVQKVWSQALCECQ